MPDSWQQTDRIVMAVQTAEIRQTSVRTGPTLFLSCNLVNIARGQCLVEITAGTKADGEAIGELMIEIDRPVMRSSATLPAELYESLATRLASVPPRPIQMTMTIASQLAVSLEGDLRIDRETTVEITDLAITMPLK